MLTIVVRVVVIVGELGPSQGSLAHEIPTLLHLCDPGRLLLIGVSLMPPTIVNPLSLVRPNPQLEPSLVCFNFVSNSSYVV